jgi:S-adenosylmethionine synthetase
VTSLRQFEANRRNAKSQVTIRYENGKPVEATQIVVSTQHYDENLSSHDIKAIVEPYVRKALPEDWITKQTVWHVNPTGKFVIGGPDGDCGLTGRARRLRESPWAFIASIICQESTSLMATA